MMGMCLVGIQHQDGNQVMKFGIVSSRGYSPYIYDIKPPTDHHLMGEIGRAKVVDIEIFQIQRTFVSHLFG